MVVEFWGFVQEEVYFVVVSLVGVYVQFVGVSDWEVCMQGQVVDLFWCLWQWIVVDQCVGVVVDYGGWVGDGVVVIVDCYCQVVVFDFGVVVVVVQGEQYVVGQVGFEVQFGVLVDGFVGVEQGGGVVVVVYGD